MAGTPDGGVCCLQMIWIGVSSVHVCWTLEQKHPATPTGPPLWSTRSVLTDPRAPLPPPPALSFKAQDEGCLLQDVFQGCSDPDLRWPCPLQHQAKHFPSVMEFCCYLLV